MWNHPALCEAFVYGLSDYITNELALYAILTNFDELIDLATHIEHHV